MSKEAVRGAIELLEVFDRKEIFIMGESTHKTLCTCQQFKFIRMVNIYRFLTSNHSKFVQEEILLENGWHTGMTTDQDMT